MVGILVGTPNLGFADNDPGAIAAAIRVMVAGGCIGKGTAGNVSYGKGYSAFPVANAAFADSTLAIAPGGAGDCASCTVAPFACNNSIGQ